MGSNAFFSSILYCFLLATSASAAPFISGTLFSFKVPTFLFISQIFIMAHSIFSSAQIIYLRLSHPLVVPSYRLRKVTFLWCSFRLLLETMLEEFAYVVFVLKDFQIGTLTCHTSLNPKMRKSCLMFEEAFEIRLILKYDPFLEDKWVMRRLDGDIWAKNNEINF